MQEAAAHRNLKVCDWQRVCREAFMDKGVGEEGVTKQKIICCFSYRHRWRMMTHKVREDAPGNCPCVTSSNVHPKPVHPSSPPNHMEEL